MAGKFQKIRKHDLKWFVLLAFFEPFMYYIGETYGLTMVESTLASVIVSTIPLFAPILAYFLLKEKIGWANVLGILVSLTGVFFVIYEPGGGFAANPLGVSLLFLAVFSAICYTTTLRKISSHYSTINIILYQSVIGLAFFIPTFFIADFSSIGTLKVSAESLGSETASVLPSVRGARNKGHRQNAVPRFADINAGFRCPNAKLHHLPPPTRFHRSHYPGHTPHKINRQE
jgi:drug/metabolite transporter (DMT)-like permease